jgi:hypothetical protein
MIATKRAVLGMLAGCFLLLAEQLAAQPTPSDSSIRTAAIEQVRRQYQQFMSTAAPLYSGPQYVEYDHRLDRGQPFFLSAAFQQGSIRYDQILYENISFKFDQVQSRLVLTDASGTFKLSPSNEKIDEFTIAGHLFIKLDKTLNTPGLPASGFYELLYTNSRFSLLKKENKAIEEELRNWGGGAFRNIVSTVNYYIKEGNTYQPIGKKKQLLEYTKDKKPEIKQFIRKNKPDFSKDMDNALITVLTYYQSLTN